MSLPPPPDAPLAAVLTSPPRPTPPPGPEPPALSAGRALVLLVGAVGTAGLILLGAFGLVGLIGREEVIEPVTFPVPVPVRHVVIDVDFGRVEVHGGDGGGVSGTRTIVTGFRRPELSERVEGDTLRISSNCPRLVDPWCGLSYDLDVPREASIEVTGGAGAISVEGIDGAVRLRATVGGISVDDVGGTVDLEASAGHVEGRDLRATRVRAATATGGVRLEFAVAPTAVTARADEGRVRVSVPRDGTVYRVEASAANGEPDVLVDTSPVADRVIVASTGSGTVAVDHSDP